MSTTRNQKDVTPSSTSTSTILKTVNSQKNVQLKIQTNLIKQISSEPNSLEVNYNGDNLLDFTPPTPSTQRTIGRMRTC